MNIDDELPASNPAKAAGPPSVAIGGLRVWLGNLTSYGWDTENRLLRIAHPSGGIETNTYHASGLRESYTGPGTDGRRRFIYDGVNVVLDKLPGGTHAVYTQQPETPGGLYADKADGLHRFHVPDMQGHIRALTDANGAVTDGSVIDAWSYERYHSGTSYDPYRGFGEYGYRQEDTFRHEAALYTGAAPEGGPRALDVRGPGAISRHHHCLGRRIAWERPCDPWRERERWSPASRLVLLRASTHDRQERSRQAHRYSRLSCENPVLQRPGTSTHERIDAR